MDAPMQGSPEQASKADKITESALGLVSTLSFPAIIQTADSMLKSSDVTLIGFENWQWSLPRLGAGLPVFA